MFGDWFQVFSNEQSDILQYFYVARKLL